MPAGRDTTVPLPLTWTLSVTFGTTADDDAPATPAATAATPRNAVSERRRIVGRS
jgi:hypothetical protein